MHHSYCHIGPIVKFWLFFVGAYHKTKSYTICHLIFSFQICLRLIETQGFRKRSCSSKKEDPQEFFTCSVRAPVNRSSIDSVCFVIHHDPKYISSINTRQLMFDLKRCGYGAKTFQETKKAKFTLSTQKVHDLFKLTNNCFV